MPNDRLETFLSNTNGPLRDWRAVRALVSERLEVGAGAHLDLTWGVTLRFSDTPGV
jgi:hypothetical protein